MGNILTFVAIGFSSHTFADAESPALLLREASQLVTLSTQSPPTFGCNGANNIVFFNVRVPPNAYPKPFSIPIGEVLVIKSAEVVVTGSPGRGAEVRLLIGSANQGLEMSRETVAVDTNGRGTANFQLSSGVAIAAGYSLCAVLQNGNAAFFAGTAHGFLAPNK